MQIAPDGGRATPLNRFSDLPAATLISPHAAGKVIRLNPDFTDIDEQYLLVVKNGVLRYAKGKQAADADATVRMTRTALDQIVVGETTLADKLAAGEVSIAGDRAKLGEFLAMMDNFEFWFNIVTP